MKYRIVLVPFPFDDLSGSKLRPALCLTSEINVYRHVVLAFITSQLGKATESSDIPLFSNHPDFPQTGLKVDSTVCLHRLVSVPTRLMQRQLGVLPQVHQGRVEAALKHSFVL